MPPKKADKEKEEKAKKKKKDDGTLELEDKYQRTVDEMAALKDQMAARKVIARRALTVRDRMVREMADTQLLLQTEKTDHKAVSADLTRQYKTLQSEMSVKIQQLEIELDKTRMRLDHTKSELRLVREERARTVQEKDEEITVLQVKVSSMEKAYEALLTEVLDMLVLKLTAAQKSWKSTVLHFESKNKELLLELGLKPLCI